MSRYYTLIEIPPEMRRFVEHVCRKIRERDRGFIYEIRGNLLVITSGSKKKAYARGNWFHEKLGLYYEVRAWMR